MKTLTAKTIKTDMAYEKFLKRLEEVMELPPQQFGRFTNVYKTMTGRVKTMPWIAFFALSAFIVGVVYMFFGSAISWMVTLLQRGF